MTAPAGGSLWVAVSDAFRFGLWGVLSRPAQNVAVAATLAAGISAVILAVGIVRGYAEAAERAAFGVYSRSLVIRPNVYSPDTAQPARLSDVDRLAEAVSGADTIIAWRSMRVPVATASETGEIELYGVHGDAVVETGMGIAQGRALTPREWQGADRVCVLGEGAAQRLFPDGGPVGETLRLGGIGCTVVGVMTPSEARTSDRFDQAVITPFTAAARYFQPPAFLAPDEASWITVILAPGTDMHEARIAADRTLRQARGVPLSRGSPYRFDDPGAPRRAIERERALMTVLVAALAVVSMAAALIGYTSVLSSSVMARRDEIATRMSIGARTRHIIAQFFAESLIVGAIGGAVGGLAGIALTRILSMVWGWATVIDLSTFLVAVLLGLLSGAVGGVWPARKAARSDPWKIVKLT